MLVHPVAWLTLAACSPLSSTTEEAVLTYARIADASYADTLAGAQALDASLQQLVAEPTAARLTEARDAWLASREPYLQTEVYRFYDGPIDDPDDGPEGLINAWPLDEAFVDYVEGAPESGIVNGTETIDGATLESLNESGGEKNISTGYHAIEFLLWGQDRSAAGPGDRPATDYATDGTGTAANQDRRATYLTVAGGLLVGHLGHVRGEWAADAGYRTTFEADPEGSIEDILTGMIVLAGFETGGERLQAALDAGDQEEEHSCFSDNTHRDMIQDVQGIVNVWEGRYGDVSGTGVRDVIEVVDAELAGAIDAQLADSLALANALQPPFDQEIVPGAAGNARVEALIISLRETEDLLSDAFAALGLTPEIPTE